MADSAGLVGSLFKLDLFLALKLALASIVLYPVWCVIYNLFFHPLRHFPGPWLCAATQLRTSYVICKGRPIEYFRGLHAKYGEVVRTKPNELAFTTESAWRDIYMHRQGKPQMEKAHRLCFEKDPNLHNIITGDDETHARQRRAISHAFSDKALKEQEPLIQHYVDMFVENVRLDARSGRPFDIIEHLNWASFDIIGDLAFGEPFGALQSRETHPWIHEFFKSTQLGGVMYEVLEFLGPLKNLFLRKVILPAVLNSDTMSDFALAKIQARIDRGVGDRPDLMSFVLRHNEEGKGMSKREIVSTFNILVVAGSETIGSALSGTIYLCLKNPDALKKLQDELRSTFKDDKEINLTKTSQLTYLNAVIQEAFRVYPPPPVMLRRVVEPEGTTISGYKVAGGTFVGIPMPTAYISPHNFSEPNSFIPERWLDTSNPRFANDKRGVVKPFSAGARNCVGQNLATSEMKLLFARLMYNFDLELEDPNSDWLDQEARVIRIKPPLMVRGKDAQLRK